MYEPGDQLVIHKPLDGETLDHYLERYSNEETLKIIELPEKLSEYSSVLMDTSWPSKSEQSWEKIWKILRRTDNFEVLLHHIKLWEPTRKELVTLLTNSATELSTISKWGAGGKFFGCAIESGSTVAGLFLKDTGSSYSEWLLYTAQVFGVLGLGSTLLEMNITHDRLRRIAKLVKRDKKFFAPIKKWYKQTAELEDAMKNVFPFDFTEALMKDYSICIEKGPNYLEPVQLLPKLLTAIAEVYSSTSSSSIASSLARNIDKDAISCITQFLHNKEFKRVFEWLVFRKNQHPISIDMSRMFLQYYHSPLQYVCCQSIRALAPENQNLFSVPVFGRIALNCYSCADAVMRFWSHEEVHGTFEIKQLAIQLDGELKAWKKMVNVNRPIIKLQR